MVHIGPDEFRALIGLGDDGRRCPSVHTEEQVQVLTVVLVLRSTVEDDLESSRTS